MTGQAYVFELSLTQLTQGNVPDFKPLSKYPQVRRDIALLVDESLPLQSLQDVIEANAGDQLLKSWVFDVYQGEGVASNKKSVAIAMSFQHQSKSLNDEEVQQIVDNILQVLEKQLAAVLR
jgi:phenylalanyl-tRNA synthetase beta chain